MANGQYLIPNKGQEAVRRDLTWLFGVPTAAAGFAFVYLRVTSFPSAMELLVVGGVTWLISFSLMSKILESAPVASGTRGELKVQASLAKLPADYILFDTVRLPHAQSRTGERELDFVVIGKRRVFVIEVKNNAGRITPKGLWDREWPVKTLRGAGRSMRNPLRQVYGQRKTLEARLAEHGIHLKVQPIVMLSNPDCAFRYDGEVSIPIIVSGPALRETLTTLDTHGGKINQQRVADALAGVDLARRGRSQDSTLDRAEPYIWP